MRHGLKYKTLIIICLVLIVVVFAIVLMPQQLSAPVVVAPQPVPAETMPEPTPADEPASANQMQARIGSGASINGVVIVPKRVVEDSRCPMNARCIWAGRAVIEAAVTVGTTTTTKQFTLGEDATIIGTKHIRLVGVAPEKMIGTETKDTDYLFVFSVE